ncbi:hypothetical protein ABC733_01805 [Mangrovibacter sp. SLW1]
MMAFIYGSANFLLAFAWRDILKYLGVSADSTAAIKIYGVSQLAKYVPGNIFQLAGRQALGMAEGWSAVGLVKSSIYELVLIAMAGGLFGTLIIPLFEVSFSQLFSAIFLIFLACAISVGLIRFFNRHLMVAFLWQLLFLLLSGGVFVILLYTISGRTELVYSHLSVVCGAFIVAWLIGLVTPGAPAGVGVREVVLLFLLKGIANESDLLMAILFGRLVTVVGDFLFFLFTGTLLQNLLTDKKR